MKKLTLLLAICFSVFTFTSNAKIVVPAENGNDAYKQKVELLKKVSTMSVKEFEAFSGKKMNFVDRMFFKMGQKKLQKSIDENGTVTNKKLEKYLRKGGADGSSGFHLGGFALGFLLGLIGVLIAYVAFSDDNKQNRVKWSWIGLAAAIVFSLVLFLAVLGSVA
ncbi:MAG: hypothetical protein U0V75_16540 [Ferruginibacter sp.]